MVVTILKFYYNMSMWIDILENHPLVELLLTPTTVSGVYPIGLLPGVVEIVASVEPDREVREILRVALAHLAPGLVKKTRYLEQSLKQV